MAHFSCPALSPHFRVTFYKVLTDSCGHQHECPQGSIDVRAPSRQEAMQLASEKFAELHHVCDWHYYADFARSIRLT